jgi:hypothetical protein
VALSVPPGFLTAFALTVAASCGLGGLLTRSRLASRIF